MSIIHDVLLTFRYVASDVCVLLLKYVHYLVQRLSWKLEWWRSVSANSDNSSLKSFKTVSVYIRPTISGDYDYDVGLPFRGVFRGGRTGAPPPKLSKGIMHSRENHFMAKMYQIQFRQGLRPRPRWGSLQSSPDPLAGLVDSRENH